MQDEVPPAPMVDPSAAHVRHKTRVMKASLNRAINR
jgi:hypothetical protein